MVLPADAAVPALGPAVGELLDGLHRGGGLLQLAIGDGQVLEGLEKGGEEKNGGEQGGQEDQDELPSRGDGGLPPPEEVFFQKMDEPPAGKAQKPKGVKNKKENVCTHGGPTSFSLE